MSENERLYDQAIERLHEGEPEEALRLAQQLEENGYTGAFEVGALALAELGRAEDAVAYLEEGMEHAADVWINWMLLGSLRSDLKRYDDAAIAYERALACPDVPADTVRLNQAILANRCADQKRAILLLDSIEDRELSLEVADVRAKIALEGKDFKQAANVAAAALQALDEEAEFDLSTAARLAGRIAEAQRGLGETEADVRATILHGLSFDASDDYLLWLLRDLAPTPSPRGRWFRLTAAGRDDAPDAAGFIVVHQVVAENADAALAYARAIEDAEGCDDLEIDEIEDVEPCTDQPQGVYARTGRAYFRE